MNELESLLQLNKMLLAESPQYLAQAARFPAGCGSAVAAVPLARQCTGTEAGRRGFLSAAGQLAAKNNRLQGSHRLSFADADAERPVPVAGRYHHPAD